MANLIELWDRDGDYKIAINPEHIIHMRALTVEEDDNTGTVIELIDQGTIIVSNSYDDVLKASK